MIDIIERAFRNEASSWELARLAAWRRSSPGCEQEYQATIRLLRAARDLADAGKHAAAPPAATDLLARNAPERGRPRAPARSGRGWPRRAIAAAPWAVAATAVLGLAAMLARGAPASDPLAWGGGTVTTGPTELTTVTLADGSVVRLGPSSELQVVAGERTRDVVLDGQAYFDVVRMPARPFRVRTRHGRAAVLGTRFQLSTRGDQLELVVVEGRVALSDGAAEVEVSGGEASGIVAGRVTPPQPVANADSITRWIGKFLVFQDTRLSDVVREIERVYGARIAIEDTVVGSRTVRASFTNQELGHVMSVICAVVSARCVEREGELVITQ
jgi:transmembrane sensor